MLLLKDTYCTLGIIPDSVTGATGKIGWGVIRETTSVELVEASSCNKRNLCLPRKKVGNFIQFNRL